MEVSDEQLMLDYGSGNAAAFEALYARHRGALFRFVLRSVRERARAEELFQEVWMRLIEARRDYRPQARFRTWLYTIAHHRLVDHWRRHELRTVSLDDEAAAIDPPADAAWQPERRAEHRQDLARLVAALAALPPAQREAFLLQQEGGLTAPEIAAATGAGEEAVKSRLRYAHAKLRAALEDERA